MDSYELLQDLDKKHGKTYDYTVTVTPNDISTATKDVTKERRDSAKKTMADILNGKNKENSTKENAALEVAEIVVDNGEKAIDESTKDGDER